MAFDSQNFSLYDTFMDVYRIPPEEYEKYNVKRGLRNADGTGVIAGLTRVSNVHGYIKTDEGVLPDEGSLTYRGYEITELVEDMVANNYLGFERVVYLLLTGRYPTHEEALNFARVLNEAADLPAGFIAGVISEKPPRDIMNSLIRSTIALYPYDEHTEDIGSPEAAPHEIHAAISLIGKMPRLGILAHYAADLAYNNGSMFIHRPLPELGMAENILSMLRPDRAFTKEEAQLLDIMLMIHAEHGGGNNSTFTCRCLTSSGTDPYSAYAGAIASLKGPKHGGANIRALEQQNDIMACVSDPSDEGQVADYLRRTLARETFDHAGLIYGMGHAIYTLSDPRAVIIKKYAKQLARGTEYEPRFQLIETIERLTPDIMAESGKRARAISANVDMYSGLVYSMLGIPKDLFTPLFACARMAGWAAHRFEEIYGASRIMRPAYKTVGQQHRSVDEHSEQRDLSGEGA